jgi:hypothetical protein
MKIKVEPSTEHKMPYNVQDDETETYIDELKVVANTQSLIEQLNGPPEMDTETAVKSAKLFEQSLKTQNKETLATEAVAYGAKAFVQAYSKRLAFDMNEVRTALTTKLLELANCGDARFELKAIELLGKHSDIALFTERSEVTVNYKTSSDLEEAIKERVKRLLNADVIDVTPLDSASLDDMLGVAEVKPRTTEEGDKVGED